MTYSLVIYFFSHSLAADLQNSKQRTPSYIFDRILNMAYELSGRKRFSIFRNVITLQIILRNEIPENNGLFKVTGT